jgi:hypothetical protein
MAVWAEKIILAKETLAEEKDIFYSPRRPLAYVKLRENAISSAVTPELNVSPR